MGTRTADYLDAIEHLPDGTILVIPQSSWDEYERLLADLVDWPGMRVTYDRGRLEIMSPSREHEEYKEFIARADGRAHCIPAANRAQQLRDRTLSSHRS